MNDHFQPMQRSAKVDPVALEKLQYWMRKGAGKASIAFHYRTRLSVAIERMYR